ncbi:SAM-dependent methyltransferase [Desulfoferrobacter suflitae]|uniref:SAM-dependent methyltransferase n=1 Tax=Desulfoferrobacter suflitae TaxID=2865782 RepID=UPI002164CE9F|nr:cyclopropane-fatty-acyl-phospholipid synthase family protein [Desulfoferrobacter suflitae]MCK8603711.1 cyclopropane-fatty-acyl-phospholipid synthase family protein [Desulfoferrobacter suflitae]
MTLQTQHKPDRLVRTSLSFFQNLLGDCRPRDFAVRFWDGTTWEAEPGRPTRFTLVIRHPGALRNMFWLPNDVTLGEAYLYDDFDVEGDIESVFALRDHIADPRKNAGKWLRCAGLLLQLPRNGHRSVNGRRPAELEGACHSKERDRQAVTYHYDVSNEFFSLWLDSLMNYSCAYFESPDEDLDTAQQRKLDYLCRKLRLKSGERLLDIGCGWGGLVMHAAREYQVRVLGITLSKPQAELANQRIREAGLADRCRVEVRDYRDIDEPESYDKLVSVGMFEHVGEGQLFEYFNRAWRLLKPGGVFLNHGIGRSATERKRIGPSFIDTYVFPDSDLLPINSTLRVAELSGFEVRDVENLREHYALTLRHWVRRLEAQHDEACSSADEVTYRVWRLYMAGSAYGFEKGQINVYQTLLAKLDRGKAALPLTRADWYR